jgi:L-threonine-O-3-phosphate decarboxylase
MAQQSHGGNLSWAAALVGCSPDAIVDFSASISPLGPPNSVIAAITYQFSNLKHYPDLNYSELKLALGKFHNLPPEWIMPGNGSAELLTLLGRELGLLAGTMLFTPAFGDYYRSLASYDAKVLEFPLDLYSDGIFFSPLPILSISCSHEYGLLLNNPHNPTGKLFPRDDILHCLKNFALVVVDEAFMDFLPPEQQQSLISWVQEYDNLVILRSLTKFYSLPGLRLGYAIAHPDLLKKWQSWRDPWPVNTLAAAAAIAAVADTDFQQLSWNWLPQAQNQLFEGLSSINGLRPIQSAVNYFLVESRYSTSELQSKLLQQYQVLIRDCGSFQVLGDRYFRVAVRSESDNDLLLTSLNSVIACS